ncbi:hypothetical protein GCM10017612_24410 [Novosphingobium resinovorum]|nr:hypothetical protein GCM10017612_24410 [Novosphingobium resinovorum]
MSFPKQAELHRLYTTAKALVCALVKAHGEGRLQERLPFLAKPKLLIVDELGYLPFDAAYLFFQLVARATSEVPC